MHAPDPAPLAEPRAGAHAPRGREWAILPVAIDTMQAHADGAAPAEACGWLVGTLPAPERTGVIRNAVPSPQSGAADRSSFQLSPASFVAASKGAGTMVGYYHSHPGSAPTPSRRDVAGSLPGLIAAIVAPASDGGRHLRFYDVVVRAGLVEWEGIWPRTAVPSVVA